MKLEISEKDSLADAFAIFKASYGKGDFLAPSEVPLVIRLLENPSYSFKLFGIELFPGRVTLERHDYLHALMGMRGDTQGEAFVIGTTMGSTGKMNKFKIFLFVWLENLFTPKKFHYDSVAARKVFYQAVEESSILAKEGVLKDLSTFDIENHLFESVESIRKMLGLDILMRNLSQ